MAQQRTGGAADKAQKHVIEEAPRAKNGVAGKIHMAQDVVETIAAMAARQISGIHALGKSRLIPFGGSNPRRGVQAEVGQKEVALDLEVIIEHGCDVRQVAQQLRESVAREVDRMAGRKVIEVNLDVVGVHVESEEPEPEPEPERRVR